MSLTTSLWQANEIYLLRIRIKSVSREVNLWLSLAYSYLANLVLMSLIATLELTKKRSPDTVITAHLGYYRSFSCSLSSLSSDYGETYFRQRV